MEELRKGELVARSRTMGKKLLSLLTTALAGVPEVREVRGKGLFVGVDLRHPDTTTPMKGVAVRAATLALREGILILPAGAAGHVLELSPPLLISEEQIDWAVPRLKKVIEKALAE